MKKEYYYQFIEPSVEGRGSNSEGKFEPKGLSQIAAYLHESVRKRNALANEKTDDLILSNFEVVDQGIAEEEIDKIIKNKSQLGDSIYYVFLSILGSCAKNALEIAKKAKKNRAIIIAGNDHATHRYKQLLLTGLVDYILLGDNVHQQVVELIETLNINNEENLRKIPFLAYRDKDGNIIKNTIKADKIVSTVICKNTYSILDENVYLLKDSKMIINAVLGNRLLYTRINILAQKLAGDRDQNKIRQNNLNRIDNSPVRKLHRWTTVRQATIDIAKGCRGGLGGKPCIFCSICDVRKMEAAKPEFVVDLAVEMARMNYNFLYVTTDDLTSFAPKPSKDIDIDLNNTYLGKLALLWENTKFIKNGSLKKLNEEIELYAYAQAHNISRLPSLISLIKKMNVIRLNIGFESGSDTMLLGMGKAASARQNMNVVKLLKTAGIQLHTSFVLGSIGETEKTLDETLRFIEEIVECSKSNTGTNNIVVLEPSIIYPAFNTKMWNMLTNIDQAIEGLNYFLSQLKYYANYKERTIDLSIILLLEDRLAAYRKMGSSERKRLLDITKRWANINRHASYIEDTKQVVNDWIELFCFVDYQRIQQTIQKIGKIIIKEGIKSGTFAGVQGTF